MLKIQPVLDLARKLDIGSNPVPEAIFDPLIQGFNVWCTPQDNPGGLWKRVADEMTKGAFTKPCEYVGTVFYDWQEDLLEISTDAYALQDAHLLRRDQIKNRTEDIVWLASKIARIFEQAGEALPKYIVKGA